MKFGSITVAAAVAAVAAVFHLDVVVGLCSDILEALGRFHEQFSEGPVKRGGRIVQECESCEGAQTGGILPFLDRVGKYKINPNTMNLLRE